MEAQFEVKKRGLDTPPSYANNLPLERLAPPYCVERGKSSGRTIEGRMPLAAVRPHRRGSYKEKTFAE